MSADVQEDLPDVGLLLELQRAGGNRHRYRAVRPASARLQQRELVNAIAQHQESVAVEQALF
jgi:hypothetical protein